MGETPSVISWCVPVRGWSRISFPPTGAVQIRQVLVLLNRSKFSLHQSFSHKKKTKKQMLCTKIIMTCSPAPSSFRYDNDVTTTFLLDAGSNHHHHHPKRNRDEDHLAWIVGILESAERIVNDADDLFCLVDDGGTTSPFQDPPRPPSSKMGEPAQEETGGAEQPEDLRTSLDDDDSSSSSASRGG